MKWPAFPKLHPRTVAGGGIYALTTIVLAMIFFKPALADNDLFKMLAQAIVAQGLVGLAMAHYFTATHRDAATGHTGDPVHVQEERADRPDA